MNKTTYIILGIVAVLAVVAAIYFYKKSQEQTVIIQQQPNPNQTGDGKTQGIFNLITGLGTVLGNVDWRGIFGGGNGGNNVNHNCPQGTTWDTQFGACLPPRG